MTDVYVLLIVSSINHLLINLVLLLDVVKVIFGKVLKKQITLKQVKQHLMAQVTLN